jgi:peroxiredoxin
MKNVIPGKVVPELIVETVNGMIWNLRDQKPKNFTLVVFYRGIHCPVCKSYLEELNSKIDKFRDKGVNVICISSNSASLAEQTATDWDIDKLTLGFNYSIEDARKWDLFISKGINDKEPEMFFEPGLFLIRPDNTLYAASIQSMPFARPKFDDLLKSISFVLNEKYPARGEA